MHGESLESLKKSTASLASGKVSRPPAGAGGSRPFFLCVCVSFLIPFFFWGGDVLGHVFPQHGAIFLGGEFLGPFFPQH